MSLSCSCYEPDDPEWWWFCPDDYSVLNTKRARRCKSCGEKIPVGSVIAKFERGRRSKYGVEERIWGDADIPMAPWYHCERCADLYFSLEDLGFCVEPNDDMRELIREYATLMRHKENT